MIHLICESREDTVMYCMHMREESDFKSECVCVWEREERRQRVHVLPVQSLYDVSVYESRENTVMHCMYERRE